MNEAERAILEQLNDEIQKIGLNAVAVRKALNELLEQSITLEAEAWRATRDMHRLRKPDA